MANSWPTTTIDKVTEKIATGPFGSSIKVETFVSKGVPIISGQHLHESRLDDTPGFDFITEEHAQRLANAFVRRGDVVLTHAGTIGQVAYIPDNSKFTRYIISPRQFYLRCDKTKVIPEFVTMYFKSPEGQHQLLANTSQVGVPSIAQPVTYIRTVELPVPPLTEQCAIVHVLSAIDEKIACNRSISELLEESAQAIFNSWFVDFEPVYDNFLNRSSHLPKNLANLFPNRFVDSELGQIPIGWQTKTLGDVLELNYGKSLKANTRQRDGKFPVYGSNGQIDWHNERLVKGPGIVVGRKGNPGTVNWVATDFFPIDTTFYVVPKGKFYELAFLFHALKNQNLASLATDTAVPGLNRNLVYMNKFTLPVDQIVTRFSEFVEPLFFRRYRLEEESRKLVDLRDTLLPNLISGKIRIKDAEKLLRKVL